jgi:hypothetical protein
MRCPVCKSENVRRVTGDIFGCGVCGTTDSVLSFSPHPDEVDLAGVQAEFDIGNDEKLTHFYPPENIVRAVQELEAFFQSRGAKSWAYGPIQSRSSAVPSVPVTTLDTIRAQAAAFGCDVVPRGDKVLRGYAIVDADDSTFSVQRDSETIFDTYDNCANEGAKVVHLYEIKG